MRDLLRFIGCLAGIVLSLFTVLALLLLTPFLYLGALLSGGRPPRVVFGRRPSAPPPSERPAGEDTIDVDAVEVESEVIEERSER